jgi:hypothetical protein
MTWPSHFVQTSVIVSLASTLAKDDALSHSFYTDLIMVLWVLFIRKEIGCPCSFSRGAETEPDGVHTGRNLYSPGLANPGGVAVADGSMGLVALNAR